MTPHLMTDAALAVVLWGAAELSVRAQLAYLQTQTR